MKVPMPCKLGENINCIDRLVGVSWFKWSKGYEYTYYTTGELGSNIYVRENPDYPSSMIIPDFLVKDDTLIKDCGYPLKGRGHAYGICFIDGSLFMDFIITSNYYEHILVQCDENCEYVNGGRILFPPNWDTPEKQKRALLRKTRYTT